MVRAAGAACSGVWFRQPQLWLISWAPIGASPDGIWCLGACISTPWAVISATAERSSRGILLLGQAGVLSKLQQAASVRVRAVLPQVSDRCASSAQVAATVTRRGNWTKHSVGVAKLFSLAYWAPLHLDSDGTAAVPTRKNSSATLLRLRCGKDPPGPVAGPVPAPSHKIDTIRGLDCISTGA